MRKTPARILLVLFLVTSGSLALIGWIGYTSATRLAEASNRTRQLSLLRTQLNSALMEVARLDALALRDVLSDETLYEDPPAAEAGMLARLRQLGSDLEAAGVDAAQVEALIQGVTGLLRSGREQIALKTTEPREYAQHDRLAQEAVRQQEIVAAVGGSLDLELDGLSADALAIVQAETRQVLFLLFLAAFFAMIVIISASVMVYRTAGREGG